MLDRVVLDTRPGRVVGSLVASLVLAVIVGLVVLWPEGDPAPAPAVPQVASTERATVVAIAAEDCEAWAGPGCQVAEVELDTGRFTGRRSFVTLPDDRSAPRLSRGDRIRVTRNVIGGSDGQPEDVALDDPSQQPLAFVDFERSTPLLALALLFGVLVVILGRWHGVRALVGLGLSLVIVTEFLVPSILDGNPPLAAALVGGLAVMVLTLTFAHGVGLTSLAAMLGTAAALVLTALLALAAVRATDITGLSSEQATLLLAGIDQDISLQGLVLAGMVVGALGVLDDVTVAQASTVLALRRANEQLGFRRLCGSALAVGRDHLGATVNTLVLAYAGAALPVLLIFHTSSTPFSEAVNREPVAEQVVAMLVGSIGLIAAVPLTTAVAAALAAALPVGAMPAAQRHGHLH